MPESAAVLSAAVARARDQGVAYDGAVLPAEARHLLDALPSARLVDVRTRAEWDYVGRVPGSLEIEWQRWPGGVPNAAFMDELQLAVPDRATPLLFMCRSGARSHAAATAAKAAGYRQVFNVLEGFEGDRDAAGHRNTIGGWRAAGLPWTQS
ncbi:MAG: rhodanese-like domain-containing protein [Burkholderiales bacterium]|jgi:rhodanese-related sulfurtransferase|nr:rhodanese-like domain-containing protein [Burkholderiales bacterium]